MSVPSRSVLVVGATGRSGQAILKALQARSPKPEVHAFARTPSKLPDSLQEGCTSVVAGDGSDRDTILKALEETHATDAILCTGVPNGLAATDVRTKTGRGLAEAVKKRHDTTNTPTRVVVVSALGASGSTIRIGWGIGTLVAAVIGLQLKDHDEQERLLREAFKDRPGDLLIARPVGLKDAEPTGSVRVHDGEGTVTLTVSRADMASWIVTQICEDGDWFGKTAAISA